MKLVPIEVIGLGSHEPSPGAQEGFLELARDRGWKVVAEWVPPWEDETGEQYGGFWSVLAYREEMRNGEILHFHVDIPTHIYEPDYPDYPDVWGRLFDLYDAEWQRFREEQATKDGASR